MNYKLTGNRDVPIIRLRTYQSSTWENNGVRYSAERGVDLDEGTCSTTNINNVPAWWALDLLRKYNISRLLCLLAFIQVNASLFTFTIISSVLTTLYHYQVNRNKIIEERERDDVGDN